MSKRPGVGDERVHAFGRTRHPLTVQDVVPQLERLAGRSAEGTEALLEHLRRTREGRADQERPLDRVRARLQLGNVLGGREVSPRRPEQIEVLPGRHLDPHPVEADERDRELLFGEARRAEEGLGQHGGEVAHEHGDGAPVRRG